ncbi:allergen [Vararia minispora EC-137]|uniref:Allergen n=1 Tax=Vararia minispora EC-137 TaxID=1314806 RepID=A0ACB8QCP9_9AGAM|nr:allergen [Vararia minispora EC-137]
MPLPNVFFDFAINGAPAGRVVFRLFDDTAPFTSRNFRELATGQHGFGYAGSEIHRIIPGFMIQGGDITDRDGTGGRSIYGRPFGDETFEHQHDKPGRLSMGNRGPHTNTSQFFITTAPGPHCDGQNVVFGEVVSGLDVVRHVQAYASSTDILRRPVAKIVIERCGVVAP